MPQIKLFPIQAESRRDEVSRKVIEIPRILIPWNVAEIAYAEYVRRYGSQQSLECLSKRGGFGRDELLDLLNVEGGDAH